MSDADLRRRSKAQHGDAGSHAVPKSVLSTRATGATNTRSSSSTVGADAGLDEDEELAARSSGFGVLDVLRMLMGLLLLSAAASWFVTGESLIWEWKPWFSNVRAVKTWLRGPLYLTDEELMAFNGSDASKPIYVGLNGSIYDVTASRHTYGPGGSYSFFSGRDAARAFITGCFQEDLTPDMRGIDDMYIPIDSPTDPVLSSSQLKIRKERESRIARKQVVDGIDGWHKVFRGDTGRPYFYVGEIKREDGWLEKLPIRTLCEAAAKSRPTRTAEKN